MRSRLLMIALALTALFSGQVRAGVVYSYQTDATNYNPGAGNQATVNLYLVETLTNSSTSLINQTGGLFSAGTSVDVNGTTGGTAAQINSSNIPTSSFGSPNAIVESNVTSSGSSGNNLIFTESVTSNANALHPDGSGRILLGTVTVTAGSGLTTYHLTSVPTSTINDSQGQGLAGFSGNTLTTSAGGGAAGPSLDLDYTNDVGGNGNTGFSYTGANASAYSFTVGAASVPEPSSVILCGLVCVGFAVGAYRRRMKSIVGEVASVA